MTSVWERFNEIEGADSSAVEDAINQYEPLEDGDYRVRLERWTDEFGDEYVFQAGESKTGLPMAKARFRIIEGERENAMIFYNQLIQNLNYPSITAKNIASLMRVLSGILGERIEFKSMGELEKLFNNIDEGIEFTINLTHNAKGYPEYKVIKELEPLEFSDSDEDEPF